MYIGSVSKGGGSVTVAVIVGNRRKVTCDKLKPTYDM